VAVRADQEIIMSKPGSPDWILSDEWAVSRNPFNWILMKPKRNGWRAVSYYPSPGLLLKSLHRKILRTDPAQPNLVRHIKSCLSVAEVCSERFSEYIDTQLGDTQKMMPKPAATNLEQ